MNEDVRYWGIDASGGSPTYESTTYSVEEMVDSIKSEDCKELDKVING